MSDNMPKLRDDIKIVSLMFIGLVFASMLVAKCIQHLRNSDMEITGTKYKKTALPKPRRRA